MERKSFLASVSNRDISSAMRMLEQFPDMVNEPFDEKFGSTALHLAAEEGNAEMITNLIKRGADVNKVDHRGKTALHIAAWKLKLDAAYALLKHGALPIVDKNGKLPQDYALPPIGAAIIAMGASLGESREIPADANLKNHWEQYR